MRVKLDLRGAVLLASVSIAVGCAKEAVKSGPPDAASSAPSASSAVEVSPVNTDRDPARRLPEHWTDPAVVTALASDCAYVPRRLVPSSVGFIGDLRPNRFTCTRAPVFSDGAPPDVCHPYESSCETGCKDGCASCDATCERACVTCKEPCHDDSCKTACATKCAECKESCTATWERCASADCAKAHDACAARLGTQWTKNNCAARCATWKTCSDACTAPDPGACLAKCTSTLSPTLRSCTQKCDYVASPEHEICAVKCYESAPCAPALCKSPPR